MPHAHASGPPSDPLTAIPRSSWDHLRADEDSWSATAGRDDDADRGRSWAVDYEDVE